MGKEKTVRTLARVSDTSLYQCLDEKGAPQGKNPTFIGRSGLSLPPNALSENRG